MLTTKEEIIQWLEMMEVKNYTINENLTVDVEGNVNLYHEVLEEIPIQFNKVSGDFICSYNNLKSLKGTPYIIEKNFNVRNNLLETLDYFPQQVGEGIFINDNSLTSLKGIPEIIYGDFSCAENKIISFKYAPKVIKGLLNCSNNPAQDFNHREIDIGTGLWMTHEEKIPELEEYYHPDGKTLSISIEQYKKHIVEYERRLAKIELMNNLSINLEQHVEKKQLKL